MVEVFKIFLVIFSYGENIHCTVQECWTVQYSPALFEPRKKRGREKKPFRAAFHRHEEGDGAYVKLGSRHQGAPNPVVHSAYIVESLQDFLIKFDMKPCIHVMEISIFSLNHVNIRLTKIMNHFLEHL